MPCANDRPELEDVHHGTFEFGFQTEVLESAATGQQPRTALQMHSLSAGEEPTGLGAMHVRPHVLQVAMAEWPCGSPTHDPGAALARCSQLDGRRVALCMTSQIGPPRLWQWLANSLSTHETWRGEGDQGGWLWMTESRKKHRREAGWG